jgi:hypothetical protein
MRFLSLGVVVLVVVLSLNASPGFSIPIVSAQSILPASEQVKMSTVEKPHQPSTSEENNSLAGNLNQSLSIPLSNTRYSYPSSNLTNIPDGTGLSPSSSLSKGAASVMQQPTQQQQLPPGLLTGMQPSMRASPPETFIVSAIDKAYGQNILSGSTVSSQFILLSFAGTDDSGYIIDFQCSYDGQPPYSCASPFTIDNSLVLIPTNIPIVPGNNTHTLLVSAVDSSRNIDQTPASFVWTVGRVQLESTETIPGEEPLASVPPTEPTASTIEPSQLMSQQQEGDIAQESLYNNVPIGEP